MTKLDRALEFKHLHVRTCGEGTVDVDVEGASIVQRCTCGAESSIALTLEEAYTILHVIRDAAQFSGAWRQAGRRVVQ